MFPNLSQRLFTTALTQNGKNGRTIAKEPLTGSIIKRGAGKGRRTEAASAERDPLGQPYILEASRLHKEKAALERPNYHLSGETPALVHPPAAVAAAAWRGKGNSKEVEAAVPMFEQGMDMEEG